MEFTSQRHGAARSSNDLAALAPGNPRQLTGRGEDVALGRSLGRACVWPRPWR
jgi:hypothetical protein